MSNRKQKWIFYTVCTLLKFRPVLCTVLINIDLKMPHVTKEGQAYENLLKASSDVMRP